MPVSSARLGEGVLRLSMLGGAHGAQILKLEILESQRERGAGQSSKDGMRSADRGQFCAQSFPQTLNEKVR